MPYSLLPHDAFSLQHHIIKPYSLRNKNLRSRIFNYILSRAKRVIRNAFGILSNRFRIFLTKIKLSPEKVENIILPSCALHNFLMIEEKNSNLGYLLPDMRAAERENGDKLKSISWQVGNRSSNDPSYLSKKISAQWAQRTGSGRQQKTSTFIKIFPKK